jgi:farnesyl-diphosphate farnesyltransferase
LPEIVRDVLLRPVSGDSRKQLLKGVSRSFYLTLRLLPGEMRGAAGLGYLLARTSDTLADTESIPVASRLLYLDWFDRSVAGDEDPPRWPVSVLNAPADPRERSLLESTGGLLEMLGALPAGEAGLVREVVAIIIGGQRLDLERFAGADAGNPVALADDAALEDYTWRVAGCVGAFWTKLGFHTLGGRFSAAPESQLVGWGITYGKGLQLVNILRDFPADLANGRCYLPSSDVHDTDSLLETHRFWVERAVGKVDAGFTYAKALRSRRLRAATVLPAMIARETLAQLHGADWETLQKRVKVTRSRVYLSLLRALAGKLD